MPKSPIHGRVPQQIRARELALDRPPYIIEHAESFHCAGVVVYVRMSLLRNEDRTPRFEVFWRPHQPGRLSSEDIAVFDRGKQEAIRKLKIATL